MERFLQLVVNGIIRSTGLNDWTYVLYRRRSRPWAALYRESWNINSRGPRIRHGTRNGQRAIGNRPVIWFEIIFRIQRIPSENAIFPRGATGGASLFVRLKSDRGLGPGVQRFRIVLQLLQHALIRNPNPFSVEFLRHVVQRSTRNRSRHALKRLVALQVAVFEQYVVDRYTLFDAQM